MRKNGKRIAAIVLAFCMVVGIIPTDFGAKVALAATGSEKADEVWSAAQLLAATTADRGLTLMGEGWSNNAATDEKTFDDGFSAVGDNAKAGGTKAQTAGKSAAGTIPDGGCYVKYEATDNGTLAINTKIGNGKTFYVIDDAGNAVVALKNETGASSYNTVSFEVSAGKTYYAYLGGATAQIWQVYLVKEKVGDYEWNAAAILAATSEDHGLTLMGEGWTNNAATDDKTFDDGSSAIGDNAKAGGTKAQTAGKSAAGTIPDGGCYVKYTAPAKGTLSINTKIGNGKTFYVIDDAGDAVVALKNETGASTYNTVSVEVAEGKTYYAYLGGATAQIWKVSFKVYKVPYMEWVGKDILGCTDETGTLVLKGEGWANNEATDEKSFDDGFSAIGDNAKAGSTKAQTDGKSAAGTIPNGGCYVVFKAPANGELAINTKIGKGKTFYVIDDAGTAVAEVKNNTDASTYNTVKATVAEGKTYYGYLGGATAQIWKVYYTPEGYEPEKEVTPWADVAAPVIKNVEVVDGDFVVTYDAVVDEYEGAEKLQVTIFYEGHEFVTNTIKTQGETTKFTPIWSGNYSFKAVAQRAGEADKPSEVVNYDNYVLAVKKPVVELVQNRGNGDVYLDWINVEGGDSFNVYVKESAASEYTSVEKGNTAGFATVSKLTAGKSYDFKIEAVRNSDNYVATYELKNFAVTEKAENKWYFGTVGSAQETHAVVNNADGSVVQTVDMETKDTTVNKQGIMATTTDIVNTDKSISFTATGNGKISDGEEGFQYFYTMVDPNKDNFELTATFELTGLYGNAFDNQSGYGIIATDMLGYNYHELNGQWIKCKQLNSVSTQIYSKKNNFIGQRNISGYVSNDTTSVEGVTRVTEEKRFSKVTPNFEVGAKYTFTLKKTNDGFISICNGEEIKYDNTAITSIQEDGSICVGVFTSRNCGVKITDIKFSTSESTGVTSVEKKDEVTPNASIFSSNTTGNQEYEYIYLPNCAGSLVVTDAKGEVVFDKMVEANKVVRVNVPLYIGKNSIKSVLTPMTVARAAAKPVEKTTIVERQILGNGETVIYVAPDGTKDGDGTEAKPYDLATATAFAAPGQYIIMKNGTYNCNNITIGRSVSGTETNPICLVAEEAGKVICEGFGLTIVGSYWNIYGLYFHYPKGVGIQISGNYNVIDLCTVEGSTNTGIQISRSGNAERDPGVEEKLWPSYNLVKNCESFDNCDAGRNDADGFAAKLTCGEGNVFYGCIAHNNVDDGWDLFAKAISGEIGKVTIENCVAYNNGWLTYEDKTVEGYEYGEGNGFKLGGNDMYGGHELINSVAYGNIGKGIASNSCPDCKSFNNTIYGNSVGGESFSFSFQTKATNKQLWDVKGLISVTTPEKSKNADQIPFSFSAPDNYIYDGSTSHNNQGVVVEDNWFVSVDMSIVPTRNEDGTINMHDLLVKTALAPTDAGAVIDTVSDRAKSVKPAVGQVENNTDSEPAPELPEDPAEPAPAPSTGDASNVWLYMIMLLAAALVSGATVVYSKKRV